MVAVNSTGRRWLRRSIFIAAVAGVMAGSRLWGNYAEPPPRPLTAARVAALTGATEPPVKVGGKTQYWRIRRGGETLYAGESKELAAAVRGYGGPFNLLVVVDGAGEIDRLILIRHNETPSYLAGIKDFFASFKGLSPTAALEPGRDVDVITRATISSNAFAAAARLSGRKILRAALARDVVLGGEEASWDWPWALVAVVFFAAAAWARRRSPELLRIMFLAAALGVWGFRAGRFVSIGDVGRFALWRFPPLGARLSLYVLLGGGALAALLWGNIYCGWLCPFGALTEFLYKVPGRKLLVAPRFARRLGGVRFAVLGAVVAAIIATRTLGAANYEPFDDLFTYAAAGWGLIFLLIVLVASVFHYRFFCKYLCAAGAALGEVAALGRRPPRLACGGCDACVAACPMAAIRTNRETVDAALCIECGRCRRVCPLAARKG